MDNLSPTPNPVPETTQRLSKRAKLLLFVLAAAVVVASLLVDGYGYVMKQRGVQIFQNSPAVDLHGKVTLTLIAKGLVAPYIYDFDANTLTRQARVNGALFHRAIVASSTGDVAYRCATVPGESNVCVYNKKANTNKIVSKNNYILKRYFEWSPDAKSVLYTAFLVSTTTQSIPSNPNKWGVFLAAADGSSEKQIALGSDAFFSPDGAAVYSLQKDGVHEYTFATKADKLVWQVAEAGAHRLVTMAVSPDGTTFAWANPYQAQGVVTLSDIVSWHPFTLRYKSELSLRAWQVQFSPDSKALALIGDSPEGNLGLYAYVLGEDDKPKEILSLKDYDKQIFLSQWR